MARLHSSSVINRDIVVPRRVITILQENNDGDCTVDELCELYLKEYMENSEVLNVEKLWI